MKLKTVFAASLLVGGVAFADSTEVTTEYTIGVLPLSISTTEALISVPWVEAGSTSGGVAVKNFIKTAGLKSGEGGDKLFWYDTANKKYAAWYINGSGEWTPFENDKYEVLANTKALMRGESALLILKEEDLPRTVYVVGQVSDASASTTIARGSIDTPAYTLIAPPAPEGDNGEVDLNSYTWTTPNKFDYIIVGVNSTETASGTTMGYHETFSWNPSVGTAGKWGTWSSEGFNPTAKVSVGRGLWYVRSGTSDMTVTW